MMSNRLRIAQQIKLYNLSSIRGRVLSTVCVCKTAVYRGLDISAVKRMRRLCNLPLTCLSVAVCVRRFAPELDNNISIRITN